MWAYSTCKKSHWDVYNAQSFLCSAVKVANRNAIECTASAKYVSSKLTNERISYGQLSFFSWIIVPRI